MQPHIHNHKLSAAVERVEGGRAAGFKSEQHTYLPRRDLALACSALPCAVLPPTAQNPVMLSCLRAVFTASHHFFSALFAKFFLARADAALLTILPVLAFMAFMAFMAFIAFMAAFMAAFIGFIARAIA